MSVHHRNRSRAHPLPSRPGPVLPGLCLAIATLCLTACGNRESAETVTITGSSTVAPIIADAARRYEEANPGVRIEVQTGGSSRGISDASSGLADFGMVSRVLTAAESETLQSHPIAADGVCVIVHKDNPVSDLSKEQLIAIYTKEVTNWSEVGGEDAPIVVANKAEGRATLDVFLEYLELDNADIEADLVVGENLHAINSVVSSPNAISYVSIGTATTEAESGLAIKLIAADGIEATMETVAAGSFPITRPLTLVSAGDKSPAAQAFLDYVQSSEVYDIVEKHFYVPIR